MLLHVAWRGRLADPQRIDAFEDAILEVALEFGGQFNPLVADDHARGGLLDLLPGLGRIPFAVGRDGRLGTLQDEPAGTDGWVAVEARFATAEGHALLVEVLEALRDEFLPGLEIRDDARYAGAHDVEAFLAVRRSRGADASPFDAAALRRRVRAVIDLPEQKRPTIGGDDPSWIDERAEGSEAEWDAMHRRNRRRDAGFLRSIERTAVCGQVDTKTIEEALRNEGIGEIPGEEALDRVQTEEGDEEFCEMPDGDEGHSAAMPAPELRFPPPVLRAQDLLVQTMDAVKGTRGRLSPETILCAVVCEMAGGLAQAIQDFDEDDDTPWGLIVVQLKRALRGVEFALGAIPACLESRGVTHGALHQIRRDLQEFEQEIWARLDTARERWKACKPGMR